MAFRVIFIANYYYYYCITYYDKYPYHIAEGRCLHTYLPSGVICDLLVNHHMRIYLLQTVVAAAASVAAYTNPYAAIKIGNDTGPLLYTVLPTFRTVLRTSQAAVLVPCKRRSSKFVNKLNCVYDIRRHRVSSLLRWRWRVDTTLVGDA